MKPGLLIASVTVSDALSDWEEAAPAVDPAAVDIVTAVTLEGTLGPQTKDRVHLCGVGVICASDANGNPGTTAGEAADYYIYMMQLRGPVLGFETADTGTFEMGIVLFDETPPGGGDPEALDQGPKSFLTGANAAYSIRFTVPTSDSPGAMFRLAHDAGEPFLHTESSTSFALVRGNVLAAFIPEQEFDGAVSGRLYGYYQVGAGAVSDTWPDMSAAMLTYEPGTLYEVHLP